MSRRLRYSALSHWRSSGEVLDGLQRELLPPPLVVHAMHDAEGPGAERPPGTPDTAPGAEALGVRGSLSEDVHGDYCLRPCRSCR